MQSFVVIDNELSTLKTSCVKNCWDGTCIKRCVFKAKNPIFSVSCVRDIQRETRKPFCVTVEWT